MQRKCLSVKHMCHDTFTINVWWAMVRWSENGYVRPVDRSSDNGKLVLVQKPSAMLHVSVAVNGILITS